MQNVVRTQVIRFLVLYGLVGALVAWQSHFVMTGIHANPYLNLLIIGVFLFGSVHGAIAILTLGNEGKALSALREAFDDTVRDDDLAARDPLWRQKRCFEPAIRFKRPRLLGNVYDLALDEIRRARYVRISLETMQTLLHSVDRKIVTDRQLLGYLSGLCIFLGLIGTFIGLMEMVGSVGGIIGGVASSDNANPDSIKQLIRDLEAPLKGMATGFSASLFGLFSSLVLGLIARFGAQATNGLRDDLEAWLSTISRIENERQIGGETPATLADGDAALRIGGAAVAVMGGMQRAGLLVQRATDAIRVLADRQAEQGEVLGQICQDLGTMSRENLELKEALTRTRRLEDKVGDLAVGVETGVQAVIHRLDGVGGRLGEAQAQARTQVVAAIDSLAQRQAEGLAQSLGAQQRVEEGLLRLDVAQKSALTEQQRAAAGVETRLGEVREQAASTAARATAALDRLEGALSALGGSVKDGVLRQERDAAALLASAQKLEERLVEQGRQRLAGEQAVVAGLARLDGALAEAAEVSGARFERHVESTARVGDTVNTVSLHVAGLSALIEQELQRKSRLDGEAAMAENAALDRLARHQAEIGRILGFLSEKLGQEKTGLDEGLREAIGGGFQQLADAIGQSQTTMSHALALLAETHRDDGSASVAVLRTELRELRDRLEGSLKSGFDDVRFGLTQTFESLVSLATSQLPDDAPMRPLPVFEEEPPQRPELDISALRRAAAQFSRPR